MKIEIEEKDFLQLIYWARRYCDGRSTYVASEFNKLHEKITMEYPEIIQNDQYDSTLYNKGQFWPYAQDGMYNPNTGAYDAMIRKPKKIENT